MKYKIQRLLLKAFSFLLTFSLIVITPTKAFAANGGRIGGSNFRSYRSIPRQIPRSYGGGSIRRNYGGYGGGYMGGYGRGIGFPFLIPFFGFGGGLFGFLVLIAITGFITNAIRSSGFTSSDQSYSSFKKIENNKSNIAQIQIGLLESASEFKNVLNKIAESSNTSTPNGLQYMLQETSLGLIRSQEYWAYGSTELGIVPLNQAESTFNKISILERSKLNSEVTTNYGGKIKEISPKTNSNISSGEYIAVTIIVASSKDINISTEANIENLINSLRIIGSISSNDLLAAEIIWQPEGMDSFLSGEDMLTLYPNLKYL